MRFRFVRFLRVCTVYLPHKIALTLSVVAKTHHILKKSSTGGVCKHEIDIEQLHTYTHQLLWDLKVWGVVFGRITQPVVAKYFGHFSKYHITRPLTPIHLGVFFLPKEIKRHTISEDYLPSQ